MQVYIYDETTKKLTTIHNCQICPETKQYLYPKNYTKIPPIEGASQYEANYFINNKWELQTNYTGASVWNKETGQQEQCKEKVLMQTQTLIPPKEFDVWKNDKWEKDYNKVRERNITLIKQKAEELITSFYSRNRQQKSFERGDYSGKVVPFYKNKTTEEIEQPLMIFVESELKKSSVREFTESIWTTLDLSSFLESSWDDKTKKIVSNYYRWGIEKAISQKIIRYVQDWSNMEEKRMLVLSNNSLESYTIQEPDFVNLDEYLDKEIY